jgi:MFS superfamily sulfate permease-like transporter
MPVASQLPQWVLVALPLLVLWDIAWRGMALWRSARRTDLIWFVVLLVVNSLGILPIVYLLLTRDKATTDAPNRE